jgi:D-glycero-alpha-D-manno-heptose-7-phosphate kinase
MPSAAILPTMVDVVEQQNGLAQRNARLEQFTLHDSDTMRAAMILLERNGCELVCICSDSGRLVGVLSNGDIRRATLAGIGLDNAVSAAMNREFVAAPRGTARERILKMLDSRTKAVPIVDEAGLLVDLVAAGLRYVQAQETENFARARAPARLSLAGGGTDFTSYFVEHGGLALTATVNRHARAILRRRSDSRVIIHAYDAGQRIEADSVKGLSYDGTIDLIKAGIAVMEPAFGFELYVASEMPTRSGLGGSAALLAAIIGCFNEFRDDKFDLYEIAEHAFEAERMELGVSGGWQDQYATVFGGFNFLEFSNEHNVVTPLRLQSSIVQELEERCILCYTGRPHKGEQIQSRNAWRASDDRARNTFADEIKAIGLNMRGNLLRGNLEGFGRALGDTWRLKKQLDPDVRDSDLDAIYDLAITSGCEGGRLLGTGGGGSFLFFAKPFRRFEVASALNGRGLQTQPVLFDNVGLQSWIGRGNIE